MSYTFDDHVNNWESIKLVSILWDSKIPLERQQLAGWKKGQSYLQD